jgi:hypothetical protein
MAEFLYCEPIKGAIFRYVVLSEDDRSVHYSMGGEEAIIFKGLGTNLCGPGGLMFHRETDEWKIRYQDSLSARVSQAEVMVYFVQAIKRGKRNQRVLVIDCDGRSYSCQVPLVPDLEIGDKISKLQMDLTVVSVSPVVELRELVFRRRGERGMK